MKIFRTEWINHEKVCLSTKFVVVFNILAVEPFVSFISFAQQVDLNCGGWGLYLKTEDLAKMGQLLLQKGQWNGRQVIPAEWVTEMSRKQVESINPGTRMEEAEAKGMTQETSDWMQGYGYQMWRCCPGCFRADGARGQYIIVVPGKSAVIAITSDVGNLQGELNLVWKHILPVL